MHTFYSCTANPHDSACNRPFEIQVTKCHNKKYQHAPETLGLLFSRAARYAHEGFKTRSSVPSNSMHFLNPNVAQNKARRIGYVRPNPCGNRKIGRHWRKRGQRRARRQTTTGPSEQASALVDARWQLVSCYLHPPAGYFVLLSE